MATVLKNVLQFVGLTVGVPVATAHGININGLAVAPDLVLPTAGGFTITADSINVTVTREADASADVNIYVERWHSYERSLPLPGQLSGLIPIIINGGGSSGSVGPFAIASSPQNNYSPTGFDSSVTLIVIAPTVNLVMTGLAAMPDGTEVEIANRSPNGASCSFVVQSSSSTDVNRFLMPDEVVDNWVLAMDCSARFRYDGTAQRWKLTSWLSTSIPKLVIADHRSTVSRIDTLYIEGSAHKLIVDELEIHGQGQGQVALYTMTGGDYHDFEFNGDPITGNKLAAWFWGTLSASSASAMTGIASGVVGPYTASTLGRVGYFFVNPDSANSVTFKHDTGSAPGNRLYLPGGANIVVRPGGHIAFRRVNVNGIDGWVLWSAYP